MKISEFNMARDQNRVLELLAGEAETLKRFQNAIGSRGRIHEPVR